MDSVIWAAIIAGGVSVVGNGATMLVARFGRDAQREQMKKTADVEVAKINAEAERVRDERRETARRERRELYSRVVANIQAVEAFGGQGFPPNEDEFDHNGRELMYLQAELTLAGADAVIATFRQVITALHALGGEMRRFQGDRGERFYAAFNDAIDDGFRGDAITVARAQLVVAMRDDVTTPHLPGPEPRPGAVGESKRGGSRTRTT